MPRHKQQSNSKQNKDKVLKLNDQFAVFDKIWKDTKPKKISAHEADRVIADAAIKTVEKPVKKNRVVLDIPIFISALLQPDSIAAQFMEIWSKQQIQVLMSLSILSEIEYLLRHPHIKDKASLTEQRISKLLDLLNKKTLHVPGQLQLSVLDDHPSGNAVLSCAVEGNANYIISNDPQLLNLKFYKGILILSPSSLQIIL